MAKEIIQFAYKKHPEQNMWGLPTLDCRVIQNPFVRGMPDEIAFARVRANPLFDSVVSKGVQLLSQHDKIYCGCLYGKHRSGAVATELSKKTGAVIKRMPEF